jgi:hypothetical protein
VRAGPLLASLLLLASCGREEAPAPPPAAAFLPAPAQAAEAARVGFPAEMTNDLGMRFAICPIGWFPMGSGEGQDPHEVRLVVPHFMGRRAVTNAQVRAWRPDWTGSPDDAPALGLSHDDAVAFAAWLTEREKPVRYRLPTEAEWEHSAVADGTPPPATGPNAWGIDGLRDGASEWVLDRFAPLPLWGVTNPEGADHGDDYVLRGGPLGTHGRRGLRRDASDTGVGFRLVRLVGYGEPDHGAYACTFVTIDPTGKDGPVEKTGYHLRLIAVIDRLTSRQMGRPLRWEDLPGDSPFPTRIVPGRYYVYAWRLKDGQEIRGEEHKFDALDGDLVCHVPVPYEDQELGPPPNPALLREGGKPREYR